MYMCSSPSTVGAETQLAALSGSINAELSYVDEQMMKMHVTVPPRVSRLLILMVRCSVQMINWAATDCGPKFQVLTRSRVPVMLDLFGAGVLSVEYN